MDGGDSLAGWTLVVLREARAARGLARAAAALGARALALPAMRVEALDGPAVDAGLRRALAADDCVFTSPNAVRFAAQRAGWRPPRRAIAVGAGTARALRRAGVAEVVAPRREDSEGLMDLPGLASVAGRDIGLVTAPGGRGKLQPALAARGARVLRADVYRRVPGRLDRRHVAALLALDARALLLLTSLEALDAARAALPAEAATRLQRLPVVAASARLAEAARERGFAVAAQSDGVATEALLAAATRHAKEQAIR